MSGDNIPVFSVPTPEMGPQSQGPLLSVPDDCPVYCVYTNEIVGFGNIPKGTINDAPPGHHNHGKPFRNIQFVEANGTYYAHLPQVRNDRHRKYY